MTALYQEWLWAKQKEREAVELRREIEDKLVEQLKIDATSEGSNSIVDNGWKIKVTRRLNRKIDADLLQEIAAENGLTSHLSDLFRWKPEINRKVWDSTSPEITRILEDAITTTAGRPSFAIEQES